MVVGLIHSNNSEYNLNTTVKAAKSIGNLKRTIIPYNPEDNGISGRINQDTLPVSRHCMLEESIQH